MVWYGTRERAGECGLGRGGSERDERRREGGSVRSVPLDWLEEFTEASTLLNGEDEEQLSHGGIHIPLECSYSP